MRRRKFIALAGGVAAWPLAARAQQSATPVIGYLSRGSPGPFCTIRGCVPRGSYCKDAGYVEGPNVAIEYRWTEELFLTARIA